MRWLALLFSLLFAGSVHAKPIEFMGLKVDAKSVAFVCDGSRWTQDKDDELVDELSAAIDALESDQQFAVLFFADGKTQTLNDGKTVEATDTNKRKLQSWLKDIRFTGDSTPVPGIVRAFESKTESIVFVTSGEFRNFDEIEAKVDASTKDRRVRIHTVGYFRNDKADDSKPFTEFMKRLAERTDGQAVLAYADELRRKR